MLIHKFRELWIHAAQSFVVHPPRPHHVVVGKWNGVEVHSLIYCFEPKNALHGRALERICAALSFPLESLEG
jgi:hypothetical protein